MVSEKFTYLLLLVFSFFFPFIFSFDKRVAFYKKWNNVIVATVIPAIFFIVWDIWFTRLNIWSFNSHYLIGLNVFQLPVEEWLFFLVIPYCSLFVYEVIKAYFPKIDFNSFSLRLLVILSIVFIGIALLYFHQLYTFWVFLLNALFIIIVLFNRWFLKQLTYYMLTFVVCIIPMFAVNGVLTSMPVVSYNMDHIIGLKIITIPVEDFFYYFLLLLMNVFIYERMKINHKN